MAPIKSVYLIDSLITTGAGGQTDSHSTRSLRGVKQVGGIAQADSVRAFKVDQYVNTADGFTGYIYDDNGDHEESGPYRIAICERDEERRCSASELILWEHLNEPVWED